MKYMGMPWGMWTLFVGSFQAQLTDVLGYNEQTAKAITRRAKAKYKEILSLSLIHILEYLIPATTWDNDSSNIFVYHSYKGKKSKPEYGLNISAKNISQLERFKLENMITAI